jgi:nucleoside phosphorylase
MNPLFLAAWEPELTRFRELAGWIAMEPVGIGLVEAAIGTAEVLARRSPTHAVFIGTCGAARPGLEVGDVVFATTVALVDPVSMFEGSAVLHRTEHDVAFDPALRDALITAGAKPARVANTMGVTTTDELAARVAAHGDVEHLEAFGVVRACARANVECAVVLAVANVVGSSGRDQWKANHVAASARAAEVAFEAISRMSTTARSPA